jgi:hypothetical protein
MRFLDSSKERSAVWLEGEECGVARRRGVRCGSLFDWVLCVAEDTNSEIRGFVHAMRKAFCMHIQTCMHAYMHAHTDSCMVTCIHIDHTYIHTDHT